MAASGDVERLRARLGEFTFRAFPGLEIRAVRPAGKYPRPSFFDVQICSFDGTWKDWKAAFDTVAPKCVRDWGDLEWEDLWRDPHVGMRFLRELLRRG